MHTYTAPGRPVKKWRHSLRHYRHKDGSLRVVDVDAAVFHVSAPDNLAGLHKTAVKRVKRKRPGAKIRLLAYAPAFQRRGVLHWHVVLGWLNARERADCDLYTEICAELLEQYGFGYQFDGGRVFENAKHAASYIARYMTADHQGLERVVASSACPRRPVYVSPALTKASGITMRFLRWRRWIWHQIGAQSLDYLVKVHRLWLALTETIAANRRKWISDLIRQAHPPPIISARSTVQRVQLALPF
jgi:hypothetical protein